MKKINKFCLCFLVAFCMCFCACVTPGGKSAAGDDKSVSQEKDTSSKDKKGDTTSESSKKNSGDSSTKSSATAQKEEKTYVETHTIYAIEGVTITWYDLATGACTYKGTCESCGKTESSSHNVTLGGNGSTYNTGFTCSCGKYNTIKIGCKVTGEYK